MKDALQELIDKWREINSRLNLVSNQQETIHDENIKSIRDNIGHIIDRLTKIKIAVHLVDSKANYSAQNIQEAINLLDQISLEDKSRLIRYLLVFAMNDEENLQRAISELSMAEKRKLELALKDKDKQ